MKTSFELITKDKTTNARLGKLSTPHGEVLTPEFIPVGTAASVKSLDPHDLEKIGTQIILANTYHLLLRPGEDTVEAFGGLHKFMGWEGPLMTDSGGYQVFSLGSAQSHHHNEHGNKLNKFSKIDVPVDEALFMEGDRLKARKSQNLRPAKLDEEGVTFYSHLDGLEHRLTPESSIKIQEKLGADLIVAFDDHESPLWNFETTRKSLERTNRWGLESLKAHKRDDQLMYGVVHGGAFQDLREASAKFTNEHFQAVSIGGSYTSKEVLYNVINWCVPYFEENKPRHLLGIGEIEDIFEAAGRGIDFFDCVAPTRRARHGSVLISPQNGGTKENNFTLQVTNEQFKLDKKPVDPGCECYTCATFTKGYLNHLFHARELLAYRLVTIHNIYFMSQLMKSIREAIEAGSFSELKLAWIPA